MLHKPPYEFFQGSVDSRPQNEQELICEHWEGSAFLAKSCNDLSTPFDSPYHCDYSNDSGVDDSNKKNNNLDDDSGNNVGDNTIGL